MMTPQQKLLAIKKIALQKGGDCISLAYVSSKTKLSFKCSQGHQWDTRPDHINTGSWCPYCKNLRLEDPLREIQEIAIKRGGICLAKTPPRQKQHVLFRCFHGHEWESTPDSIKRNNSWCPVCCGNVKENALNEIRAIASNRGGQCLADDYKTRRGNLSFRCAEGHEWNTAAYNVMAGSWCPQCRNPTENLVRRFFEVIFDAPFPNGRPKWLKTKDDKQLILDGVNETIGVAFEYHGVQHFEHIEHFHGRGGRTLAKQQERDANVRENCEAHGVLLIEVETVPSGYSLDVFVAHMKTVFQRDLGREVSKEQINHFVSDPFQRTQLGSIRQIAETKGGFCHATKYITASTKMLFSCHLGHKWETSPKVIRRGCWCPICAGKSRQLCQQQITLDDQNTVLLSSTPSQVNFLPAPSANQPGLVGL